MWHTSHKIIKNKVGLLNLSAIPAEFESESELAEDISKYKHFLMQLK